MATSETVMVLQKVKHRVTMWFNDSTLRYIYPRELKHLSRRTALIHLWMFSAALFLIRKPKTKLETLQRGAYAYNGILSICKKEYSYDPCYNMNEPWEFVVCLKEDTKAMYCLIPFILYISIRQIHRDKKLVVVARDWGKGNIKWLQMCTGYLFEWRICSEVRWWLWMHNSVNTLKITELYTLKISIYSIEIIAQLGYENDKNEIISSLYSSRYVMGSTHYHLWSTLDKFV